MTPNTLYFGDNLAWLRDREAFPDGSVDLVYLDPPFNSKRDYNMVFRAAAGEDDTAQVRAFEDTWSFEGAAADYHDVTTTHDRLSRLLEALKLAYTGDRPMLSMVGYLAVMSARLIELHRVLKPTGSLYLHCDPTASHYLKMVLDAIFGPNGYLNEITWRRSHGHNSARRYGENADTILFYAKGPGHTWNPVFHAYDEAYIARHYRHVDDRGRRYKHENPTGAGTRNGATGEPWRGINPTPKGRHWIRTPAELDRLDAEGRIYWPDKPGAWPYLKVYLDDMPGVPAQAVWNDIPPINMVAAERLGYPTQKPLALLERIISASSNEGDVVLDPFCGCGTALVAAHKLRRQWLGIDITALATSTIRKRLAESFPEDFPMPAAIPVRGFPADLAGARALADADRHDFQNWVLSLLPGARPRGEAPKKGADQGIDGVWLWQDGTGAAQRGIISVKSGHVTSSQVRDLRGVIEREAAAMGLFVTLEAPKKPMLDEAAVAGRYELAGTTATFQRLQVVTVEDLLSSRLPKVPTTGLIAGFKAAKAVEGDDGQGVLGLE